MPGQPREPHTDRPTQQRQIDRHPQRRLHQQPEPDHLPDPGQPVFGAVGRRAPELPQGADQTGGPQADEPRHKPGHRHPAHPDHQPDQRKVAVRLRHRPHRAEGRPPVGRPGQRQRGQMPLVLAAAVAVGADLHHPPQAPERVGRLQVHDAEHHHQGQQQHARREGAPPPAPGAGRPCAPCQQQQHQHGDDLPRVGQRAAPPQHGPACGGGVPPIGCSRWTGSSGAVHLQQQDGRDQGLDPRHPDRFHAPAAAQRGDQQAAEQVETGQAGGVHVPHGAARRWRKPVPNLPDPDEW